MEIKDGLDRTLASDLWDSSNLIYANRPPEENESVDSVLGSQNPKVAWVRMNKDALQKAEEMYLTDRIGLDEFSDLVGVILDERGDPYDVFDW